ncbi:MAG: hypothetical protein K2H46_01035 [Muribaculaceae bacterium]|nr:hypothetical protein [Muribaculaceae bacterium]
MIRLLILILILISVDFPLLSHRPATPQGWRWNKGRGYEPFKFATEDGLSIDNISHLPLSDIFTLPTSLNDFSLSFRASNSHAHPQKRFPFIKPDGSQQRVAAPAWSLVLIFNHSDTLRISIRSTAKKAMENEVSASEISLLSSVPPLSSSVIIDNTELDCHTGINYWEIRKADSSLYVNAGSRSPLRILVAQLPDIPLTGFGFEADPAALINITDIALLPLSSLKPDVSPLWKEKNLLDEYFKKSKDPLEGYWALFDRDLEESLLRPGGNYHLALINDGDKYLLLYIGGAVINNKKWRQGMVKAILTPGLFQDIFNVEWIDAEGNPLSESIVAQHEDNGILSIQFPYHNSSLRLKKIPAK